MLASDIVFVMALIISLISAFILIILPIVCFIYCLGFFETNRKDFTRRTVIPILLYIFVFGSSAGILWLFYFMLK